MRLVDFVQETLTDIGAQLAWFADPTTGDHRWWFRLGQGAFVPFDGNILAAGDHQEIVDLITTAAANYDPDAIPEWQSMMSLPTVTPLPFS
ncbi:hypothetical protein [Magnetospirillum molischianum]|uniref:Uncharacterized protein n=1 Tax=Magnetospirillum molischianum DSM 120 TaxID=1150626 RepID=H8FY00_MAGML|nr:hypothetical protein [Magnetospirillum molischianum]CCG43238.1 hypothetical protein PHAMO_80029 [Magnetospirillum molischianum DSM 120]